MRCDYRDCPYPEFADDEKYTTIVVEPDGQGIVKDRITIHLHPECVPCVFQRADGSSLS